MKKKRKEDINVFGEGRLSWMSLLRRRLRGKRKFSRCEVNNICVGVQENERGSKVW